MNANNWVVVADVGGSVPAKRSDSSGDMEQLELMELVLMSEHASRESAEADASARRAQMDGWTYSVMSRSEYDKKVRAAKSAA